MRDLTRHQVLAHRIHAHELDRRMTSAAELRVFDLGVQDSTTGSAALSLSARLDDPDASGFTVTWTVRGAPHLHRPEELPALAKALWPWSNADALARMSRPKVDAAVDALRQTAKAMRAIVTKPMTKGEISTTLTPKAPKQTVESCHGCKTDHVSDPIFRLAALPAGLRIITGEKTITFERIPKWSGVPGKTGDFGDLVVKYLRLHGPAGPSEVASYFGTTAKEVKTNWPSLKEVTVEGRKAWLPEDVEISSEKPELVRLLPPSDPYLQARDRDLLLPDREQQKDIFRVLGRRGGVLVDGEIVGSWQARAAGKRLDFTVTPYRKFALKKLQDEAERAAKARGLGDARVQSG